MAYTLNTSHPLYGNLIELIGVQGGALVSHKTARTFTLDSSPAPSFGSGTWGEHFVFASADSATSKGASFSPEISFNTYSNPNYSVFIAVNTKGTITYDAVLINGGIFAPFLSGSNVRAGVSISNKIPGTTALGSGARSFCATATIGTSGNLYLDGVSEGTPYSGDPDTQRADAGFGGIGKNTGQGTANGCSIVWIAVFDKVLSAAETLSLHNSLGASNAFGLVSSGDTTAPTLTSASVTSVGTTTGTGNVTTNEGNGTLYSIVSTSATAPSAAQIQAGQNHTGAAAVWSGNQAVSSTGVKTFSITGLTASTAYYAHFQHKDAANNNSSVVTSAQFTTGSGAGSASGATLTGTSSLTPGGASSSSSGAASGANLTGTSSLSAGSATGNATGSFTTAAMENNTGAGLLASTSVVWTWYQGAIGAAPASTTHGTGTTNASGILTVSGLPVAAGFLLVRTIDSSGVYYQAGTPA